MYHFVNTLLVDATFVWLRHSAVVKGGFQVMIGVVTGARRAAGRTFSLAMALVPKLMKWTFSGRTKLPESRR